jgi:hypothetical protein
MVNIQSGMTTTVSSSIDDLVGAGVIWSFWEGQPPDLVLRCFESIRIHNPSRPFIVINRATLPKFLDPSADFPLFHGRRGTPDDFSKVQYLADWVRLKLLEKYGGVWLDASIICTSSVDNWITDDSMNASLRWADDDEIIHNDGADEKNSSSDEYLGGVVSAQQRRVSLSVNSVNIINMFPMHANGNVHGNWAMAAMEPGNPVIQAWLQEMNDIFNEIGTRQEPTDYIDRVMTENAFVRDRWNNPRAPPLPYLWVYLALQVVLHRQPELHSHIYLHSCVDGPMFRRYLYNVERGIHDGAEVSRATADHLAMEPLDTDGPDRWFIKLVGTDRQPIQEHFDNQTYCENSALDRLGQLRARSIVYGANVRTKANLDKVRAALHLIVATSVLGRRIGNSSDASAVDQNCITVDVTEEAEEDPPTRREKRKSILVGLTEPPKVLPTKRDSICLDFYFEESLLKEDKVDAAPAATQKQADSEEIILAMRRESLYSDSIGVTPSMITIL